ncbi:MAG TPA: hypothetical protein VGE93_02890 [Bryobacteraceae bacterium]
MSQKPCGNAGYIFRACEWNDGFVIAPRQKDDVVHGHAPAYKSTDVFVIGRSLAVNSSNPRPVKYAIGQPMLQIAD